ncbi:46412_t:CDS:2, partial [Gigaspora margarita]
GILKITQYDKWIGYKKAINKEIFEKEQYFFNIIETVENKTKKFNQNILLATESKRSKSSDKENKSVIFHSYKNTNNSNFSSEGSYYRELAEPSKAGRSARQGSWSRGWPSESKFSNPPYTSDTELKIALHNINGLKVNNMFEKPELENKLPDRLS